MTELSFPWPNSGGGDADSYTHDEFRWWLQALTGFPGADLGVLVGYLSAIAPTTTGNNNVRLASGAALVNGTFYTSDADVDVTITSPAVGTTGVLIGLRKDWSGQTVRAFALKNTDGTPGIPAVTQSDGVTWEMPIASCTITTGGVIGALADLREYIVSGSGWNVIDATTLTVAAASVDWQSIPTHYRLFRVTWVCQHTGSGLSQLRLNNDGGNNYGSQTLLSGAATVTGARLTAQAQANLAVGNAQDLTRTGWAQIAKYAAGEEAAIAAQEGLQILAGLSQTSQMAGVWSNTADLINRITIISSAGNFAVGSRFVLEGRP